MKDKIIDCICEVVKAYSLESEWTPQLEANIRRSTRFSENKLLEIVRDYNPKGILYELGVDTSYKYDENLLDRFREDTRIRWDILKRYEL